MILSFSSLVVIAGIYRGCVWKRTCNDNCRFFSHPSASLRSGHSEGSLPDRLFHAAALQGRLDRSEIAFIAYIVSVKRADQVKLTSSSVSASPSSSASSASASSSASLLSGLAASLGSRLMRMRNENATMMRHHKLPASGCLVQHLPLDE